MRQITMAVDLLPMQNLEKPSEGKLEFPIVNNLEYNLS